MTNFRRMLLSQIDDTLTMTEPKILEVAEELKSLKMFANLSEEEYLDALNHAIRTIQISVGPSIVMVDSKGKPWFQKKYSTLGVSRWDRYKDFMINYNNMPAKVVQNMEENLFKIMDLSGNPNGENHSTKGLIVGDVQSGKTANYVGLMNIAADVDYKLIIVLTGTTNTLREQTQARINEGLGLKNEGVGLMQNADYNFNPPVYLTSMTSDFTISSTKNFKMSLESTNVPIVIVTKKNSTALRNINQWLVDYSKNKNYEKIDSSLLLIDDEADYASVNTKGPEEAPTAINKGIRSILDLFTRSSYVGFTATPFANIFINPNTDTEMENQDLFPKDYIYVLGESDEYVGIQSIYSADSERSVYSNMVQVLDEVEEEYLPLKHKKDYQFNSISPGLQKAINSFFIGNVIRDLRHDTTKHRSMMINASRFTNLHALIKNEVSQYISVLKREVRLYGKMPFEKLITNKYILSLMDTYNEVYPELHDEYPFHKIISSMNESIYNIYVAKVNANSKDLSYLDSEEGERVIVVGGFSLSRGLTLEGLMVSYYYRNSVMYDSLLQMGRWFGYRSGYHDLCRIFMTQKVVEDFEFIALATDELKQELKFNSERGLTPKQFGIRVRSSQAGLIITARNKMRNTGQITATANFSNDVLETAFFSLKENHFNESNTKLIDKFVLDNIDKYSENLNPNSDKSNSITKGLVDVDKKEIISFLLDYKAISRGAKFDSKLITDWLSSNNLHQLEKWDVAFVTGDSDMKFNYGGILDGYASMRTVVPYNLAEKTYKTGSSRLGGPADGRYGLSKDQLDLVNKLHAQYGSSNTIAQKTYFIGELNRKPLLNIYPLHLKFNSESSNDEKEIKEIIPLISVGIPHLGYNKSNSVEYKVNQIYQDLEEIETMEDEEFE